ncbi:MAG: hypothetical protein JWN86_4001 [Planctomycetota bacterium]|nr:hypothetical protein [Planctomycetota bacterium]
MIAETELAVTLSSDLFRHLRSEARRLHVPLEWLVASMVVDTIDEAGVTLEHKALAASA